MIHIRSSTTNKALCGQSITTHDGYGIRCNRCLQIWRSMDDVISSDDPEYETFDNESGMPPGYLDFDWPET